MIKLPTSWIFPLQTKIVIYYLHQKREKGISRNIPRAVRPQVKFS